MMGKLRNMQYIQRPLGRHYMICLGGYSYNLLLKENNVHTYTYATEIYSTVLDVIKKLLEVRIKYEL